MNYRKKKVFECLVSTKNKIRYCFSNKKKIYTCKVFC